MKKYLFLICFPIIIAAQSNVKKLTDQLDLLSEASFNNWKYTANLSLKAEELSSLNYDDSKWQTSQLDEHLPIDSCWFRKVIEVPKFIAGVSVKGPIKFLTTVDDFGYMWINGESKGKFLWDGEFLLTEDAKPGQKYVVVIKAYNTGGPFRIIKAKLDFNQPANIQNLIRNVSLSFNVGEKLLSFDTYQTNSRVKVDPGIDKSKTNKNDKQQLQKLLQDLASKIDVASLQNGDTLKFIQSVNDVKKEIKPINDFVKQFTLQFASNAHIDAAWLWRKKETEEVVKRTFSAVMNMFKARPDFTYTQSGAAYYDWMMKDYPDLFKQMQSYVKNGRWEISGGMWVEPDCNLPSGDSWARQLLYAQNFFKNNLGKKAKIGWNPDSFGYNWNLPQFMLLGGLDAFITQKIGWNDTNVFPYRVFWWQSPDSSKILTYFPFDYVNTIDNPFELVDWLRQFESNTGYQKMLVLFGVGDHGGGPSLEMMSRIDKLKDLMIYPKIEFGTSENYLTWLRNQDINNLPVWDNELYLEYHRGTATTQANIKKWNRTSEVLLTNAEKLSAISSLNTPNNYKDDLRDAWKKVLFNQFHDILPGSGIREIYMDADADYRYANRLGNFVLKNSLNNISSEINTSKIVEGKPVVVFNPLSWERTDLATVQIPEGDFNNYSVYDINGKEIPSQLIEKNKLDREIIFIAGNIPSLGYKTYILRQVSKSGEHSIITPLLQKETSIENDLYKVTVELDSGWVKSIYDKNLKKELLSGYGNRLQLLGEDPREYEAWNIRYSGVEFPSKFRRAELIENGPVRTILRLYRDYLKPGVVKEFPTEDFPNSFFTQDIILYKGVDRIDFKTDVEWWEDRTMLKVAFPFASADTVATYEIPFGSIKRSTTLKAQWDKGKWEVNAQKWADLSNNDFGVSLLNKSKYGYDTRGNVMRLSLLRSSKWPDPIADRGDHSIEYSLFPHKGRVEQGETVYKGYEFNYPLITYITDTHKGKLTVGNSFIQVYPKNVILTSVKKADGDENALIITMYEAKGINSDVKLNLQFQPKSIVESNFLEESGKTIKNDKDVVKFSIGENQTKVIKVYY
jgi:alpha-mannosidase